jgi:hypothetical protein
LGLHARATSRGAGAQPPGVRDLEVNEAQFDEKWAFVGKKWKNCDPVGCEITIETFKPAPVGPAGPRKRRTTIEDPAASDKIGDSPASDPREGKLIRGPGRTSASARRVPTVATTPWRRPTRPRGSSTSGARRASRGTRLGPRSGQPSHPGRSAPRRGPDGCVQHDSGG